MQSDQAAQPLVHNISNTGIKLGGASPATVYRLIKSGKLDALKIGDRTYITEESIRALIAGAPRVGQKARRQKAA